jgi:hypothetical protein
MNENKSYYAKNLYRYCYMYNYWNYIDNLYIYDRSYIFSWCQSQHSSVPLPVDRVLDHRP